MSLRGVAYILLALLLNVCSCSDDDRVTLPEGWVVNTPNAVGTWTYYNGQCDYIDQPLEAGLSIRLNLRDDGSGCLVLERPNDSIIVTNFRWNTSVESPPYEFVIFHDGETVERLFGMTLNMLLISPPLPTDGTLDVPDLFQPTACSQTFLRVIDE